MIGNVELAVSAGCMLVILVVIALVLLLWERSRRRERERQWRQLDSVYNNRDRRKRGD
jgi:hypothetical protein